MFDFKCPLCSAKYQSKDVPETCNCGNEIAVAQEKGHRVWVEAVTTKDCPCCHEGKVVNTSFGWTGQISMFECTSCSAWAYSLADLERFS